MNYSEGRDTIRKQTELALHYLEKAASLTTYKNLVPSKHYQIDDYEKKTGKFIPPDYRYWLVNCGSGRIDFINSSLEIPCTEELLLNSQGGRLISLLDPAHASERIFLDCSACPSVKALDVTITDRNGCCPVVIIEEYGDRVNRVLASSWPMYIIRKILTSAYHLQNRAENLPNDTKEVAKALTSNPFSEIDKNLRKTCIRAEGHNRTVHSHFVGRGQCEKEMDDELLQLLNELATLETERNEDIFKGNDEAVNMYLDYAPEGPISATKALSCGELTPSLAAMTSEDLVATEKEVNSIQEAISLLEEHIAAGYSSLDFDYTVIQFLKKMALPSDAPKIEKLAEHPWSEIRNIAQRILCRLFPREAASKARTSGNWLQCAEAWKEAFSNDGEALQCLEMAESLAMGEVDWCYCIRFRLEHFKDTKRLRDLLRAGAPSLTTNWGWISWAVAWDELRDKSKLYVALSRQKP